MNYPMNDLQSVFAVYNPKTGKNEPIKNTLEGDTKNDQDNRET